MVEPGSRAGFHLKAFGGFLVARLVRGEDLYRDVAMQQQVAAAKDRAEATPTEKHI